MKLLDRISAFTFCAVASSSLFTLHSSLAQAQTGSPYIHDPATLAECDGKWYTFGTGGGGLVTEDGWHWHSGPVRPGGGAAPDVLKIGDRYLITYSSTGGGLGGGHNGRVLTMWNKTLDPQSPHFKYTDPIEVASSDSDEDCDAIDPGLLLDPTTNRLWLSYGTYFGEIRLIELDPQTGAKKDTSKKTGSNTVSSTAQPLPIEGELSVGLRGSAIAIDCEATDLLYRNGWYYLLGTHGTCCDGVNSTYNIVVGRSRSVEGPYLDNIDRPMLQGGGKMVITAGDRKTGPGHFGRTVIDEGVEIMSCHFEADYDMSGRSTLGIRPLLWKNDWPVAGDRFLEGEYEIQSERHGYALELAVDFKRQELPRQAFWNMDLNEPVKRLPEQTLSEVQSSWPSGNIPARIGDYMFRPHQRWQITAVPEAGGYLSNPYFKITIAGTDRALAATADKEVTTVPTYTGDDSQLWRIEQLTDGTFRIMPKRIPGQDEINTDYVLYSITDSTPTLARYNFKSDNSKWTFREKK